MIFWHRYRSHIVVAIFFTLHAFLGYPLSITADFYDTESLLTSTQFRESYRLQLWGAWVFLSVSPAPLAGSSKPMHRSNVSLHHRCNRCAQTKEQGSGSEREVQIGLIWERFDAGPILSPTAERRYGDRFPDRFSSPVLLPHFTHAWYSPLFSQRQSEKGEFAHTVNFSSHATSCTTPPSAASVLSASLSFPIERSE